MTGKSLNADWVRALQAANQALAKREDELTAAQRAVANFSRTLADKDAADTQLQADLAAAQAAVIELRKTLVQRENDLASAQVDVAQLRQSLATQAVELQQMAAVLAAEIQKVGDQTSTIASLQHERTAADGTTRQLIEALETETVALRAAAQARAEDLVHCLQAMERHRAAAAESARQQVQQVQDDRQQIGALEAELVALRAAAQASAEDLVQRLQAAEWDRDAANEAARHQAQQDRQQIDALEAELVALRTTAQARAEDLVQRLQVTERHRDTLNQTLDELRLDGSQREAEAALRTQEMRARAQHYLLAMRELRRVMQRRRTSERERAQNEAHLRQNLQCSLEVVEQQIRTLVEDRDSALVDAKVMLGEIQHQLQQELDKTNNRLLILQNQIEGDRRRSLYFYVRRIFRGGSNSSPTPNSTEIVVSKKVTEKFSMINTRVTGMNFQPVFKTNSTGEYDIDELTALHDRYFVQCAYRAILRREPDPAGEENYLSQVRAGESKVKILGRIARSSEAKGKETRIRRMWPAMIVAYAVDVPIFGSILSAILFLLSIKSHLQALRALENHVVRIAEEAHAAHAADMQRITSTNE